MTCGGNASMTLLYSVLFSNRSIVLCKNLTSCLFRIVPDYYVKNIEYVYHIKVIKKVHEFLGQPSYNVNPFFKKDDNTMFQIIIDRYRF